MNPDFEPTQNRMIRYVLGYGFGALVPGLATEAYKYGSPALFILPIGVASIILTAGIASLIGTRTSDREQTTFSPANFLLSTFISIGTVCLVLNLRS